VSLPPVLRVDEVMARYGMRDERTARRLMNQAGAFKVGGRLVIREDDLGAYERRLVGPRNAAPRAAPRPARIRRPGSTPSPADGPDWWRAEIASDAA